MRILALILALCATGCHCVYAPANAHGPAHCPAEFSIVNNTLSNVDVIQDGKLIAEKLRPGQVLPLAPVWLRTTCVTAVGYLPDGSYVGTDSYIFQSGVREVWTISQLVPPSGQFRLTR